MAISVDYMLRNYFVDDMLWWLESELGAEMGREADLAAAKEQAAVDLEEAEAQLEQAQRRRQCCDACGRAAGSSRSRWATRSTLPPPIASGGAQRAVRVAGGGGLRVVGWTGGG